MVFPARVDSGDQVANRIRHALDWKFPIELLDRVGEEVIDTGDLLSGQEHTSSATVSDMVSRREHEPQRDR